MVKAFDTSLTERTGVSGGVQAHDALLDALSALVTANNKGVYFTGVNAAALYDLSAFGRTLAALADAAALRTAAGLIIGTDVQAQDADLAAIAALTTTSYGRSLLEKASAAALWTELYGTTDFHKNAGLWRTLGIGGGIATHTGTLSETVLATVAVPAGCMGPNGTLLVRSLWTLVTSANNKTPRHKFGASGAGTGGTGFFSNAFTTQISVEIVSAIHNINNTSVQKGKNNGLTTDGGFSTSANVSGAIDTTAGTEIAFTAQLTTDTAGQMTLEHYHVEVLYGA